LPITVKPDRPRRASATRRWLALGAGALVLTGASTLFVAAAPERPDPHAGEALALDRYDMTFDEPFDKLSVSPWGGRGKRWIAHTPWNGDFGNAKFIDPRKDEPFTIVNGMLKITMRRNNGRWESGLLSAADKQSRGFLQSGGYFEMRAKLPGGRGVWPAFWLGSNAQRGEATPEIDVIEYYGQFPMSYLATTHVWRDNKAIGGYHSKVYIPEHSLENEFHTYGVSIDAENVIFYLDRREVARQRSRPEYLRPVYPMVNLAAGGGWKIDGMPDPSVMYVDYIRVYRFKRPR
jgi:beta-glucanase (GH16 family)